MLLIGDIKLCRGCMRLAQEAFLEKDLSRFSVQKTVIPEVQNDMILSVICEELGVFGAIMVLMLIGAVALPTSVHIAKCA